MAHLKHPQLFPCASKVQIPHVGADERDYHDKNALPEVIRLKGCQFPTEITKEHLKKVSDSLSFSEEVVRDRCFHLLPYSDKYFYEAVDPSSVVQPKPKPRGGLTGRHDKRGSDHRHMPCHITKTAAHHLKPMRRRIMERAVEMHKDAVLKQFQDSVDKVEDTIVKGSAFLTEVKDAVQLTKKKKSPVKNEWDEYVISQLSKNTAQWLVHQRMSPNDPKYHKFERLLHGWYGEASNTELVRDSVSEVDFTDATKPKDDKAAQSEKSPWRMKKEEALLEHIRAQTRDNKLPTDPYADDTVASFYRLPTGVRKQQKYKEKIEAGAINKTAHGIEVKQRQTTPPPTLRDHMNESVGDKMFDTDNLFQQERLTGKNQVHVLDGPKDVIIMENNNKYKKHLQPQYPQEPEGWYSEETPDGKPKEEPEKKKLEKGLHRWKSLPELIDESADVLYKLGPGNEIDYQRNIDPAMKKKARTNTSLVKIIDDWRGKWFLNQRFADATSDDLIRDMADIHAHIRLKAIMTIARAADYRPPPEMGINFDKSNEVDFVDQLPEKLVQALQCLLDDDHARVRLAAAITLFTIKNPTPKSEEILRQALAGNSIVDRWAAAQCLAHVGVCDSEVVGELVHQLMISEDAVRHEQATHLLALLSEDIAHSQLVYSMLAEQLNSSSWRHKVIACKAIPVLSGTINKDIAHKLAEMMWYDWHSEVKKAAAQCLGKTGHGKEVHDDLMERILRGGERVKADAISRLGHLGIMTAKLLPVFLKCFEDSYVTVREECCITCTNLVIKEDAVLKKLVDLASFDPIWKVKALAIQALGKIGVLTDDIKECLLWSLRYETEPAVRAEACHAITALEMRTEETAEILQERYLVECSQLVKEEITEALKMFDISPTEDMDTVAQIKDEVRKLCTRSNICAQITLNEKNDEHDENLNRLIYRPKTSERRAAAEEARAEATRAKISSSFKMRPGGSPDVLRVATPFTPTADHELEAILERDEVEEESEPSKSPMTIDERSQGVTTVSPDISIATPTEYSDSESIHRPISGVSTKSAKSSESPLAGVEDIDRQSSKLQFVQSYVEAGTPGGLGRRSRFLSSLTPRGSTRGSYRDRFMTPPKKTVLHFKYDMEGVDTLVGLDLSDKTRAEDTLKFDPKIADEIIPAVSSEGSSGPSSITEGESGNNGADLQLVKSLAEDSCEQGKDLKADTDVSGDEGKILEQHETLEKTEPKSTEIDPTEKLIEQTLATIVASEQQTSQSDHDISEGKSSEPSEEKLDSVTERGSRELESILPDSTAEGSVSVGVGEQVGVQSEITVVIEDTEGKTDEVVL